MIYKTITLSFNLVIDCYIQSLIEKMKRQKRRPSFDESCLESTEVSLLCILYASELCNYIVKCIIVLMGDGESSFSPYIVRVCKCLPMACFLSSRTKDPLLQACRQGVAMATQPLKTH